MLNWYATLFFSQPIIVAIYKILSIQTVFILELLMIRYLKMTMKKNDFTLVVKTIETALIESFLDFVSRTTLS